MAAPAAFLHGLAVAAAAASVAFGLPELRPGTDPAVGWLGGGLVLLAGVVLDLHRRLARREREALRRLDRLQRSVDALADRLDRG
ncbi:diguanylate phosphodiesterase, partial [Azospirillum brasilense]|nr:diguanylate phosphodiesterase [Azospirillum brasilense]